MPGRVAAPLPEQLRLCHQELEANQDPHEGSRVHQENHQGHEDGGRLQDEAGRGPPRASQDLRSGFHRQGPRQRNLPAQEEDARHRQEDHAGADHHRQGPLRRHQLQHRARSEEHGAARPCSLQGLRRGRQGLSGPGPTSARRDGVRSHQRHQPHELPHCGSNRQPGAEQRPGLRTHHAHLQRVQERDQPGAAQGRPDDPQRVPQHLQVHRQARPRGVRDRAHLAVLLRVLHRERPLPRPAEQHRLGAERPHERHGECLEERRGDPGRAHPGLQQGPSGQDHHGTVRDHLRCLGCVIINKIAT